MNRRVISFWIAYTILFTMVVIIIEITPTASAQTTYYVDDVPGTGPGNPPEDFTSIQDAINASITGDTVFVYNGTYYENVVVNVTINLTGESMDDTIIDGGGHGDVIKVHAFHVNISGFALTNSGIGSLDAGVRINFNNYCHVTNLNASGNRIGIYSHFSLGNVIDNNDVSSNHRGIHLYNSDENTVQNNMVSNNTFGISLESSNNSVVEGNSVSIHSDAGLYIGYSKGNDISYNTFTINENGIYIVESLQNNITDNNISHNSDDGIYLSNSDGNNFTSNDISHNSNTGFFVTSSNQNNLTSNIMSSHGTYGLYISDSDGNRMENNTIYNNPDGVFITTQSEDNIFTRNNISSNVNRNLIIGNAENNVVDNNTIMWGSSAGIQVDSGSHNTISNNTLTGNQNGIVIGDSTDVTFRDNNVSYNTHYGIYLWNSANGNTITHNTVAENIDVGIKLWQSNGNSVYRNNITGNGYLGMSLIDCSGNRMYHNDFLFNDNQSSDTTDTNHWDGGYPSGGNFWSDYVGEDLFWGPYQDIPGGEGIGDLPYEIDGDSQDRYPLMMPSDYFTPLKGDDDPPIILSVSVIEVTDSSATITWWTSEVSDSKVNWSENPDLSANFTAYVQSFTTTHSVTVKYLAPNQTYYFEVTSMDAFGNFATSNNGTNYYHFSTLSEDITPPEISDATTSPLYPEVPGNVGINLNVTDNNEVNLVFINITDPMGGNFGNFSMEPGATAGNFGFESIFSMPGTYSFTVWANDSAGNWESLTGQFEMLDTTIPEIIGPTATPSPQDVFGYVNITVTINDNHQESGVWIHITAPDNVTAGNFSMTYHPSTGRYGYVSTYDVPGTYTYVIWARDTSDNWNSTQPQTLWFHVGDVTTPSVVPQVQPPVQEYGGAVNITALITDDIGIGLVWIRILGPREGELDNATMVRFGETDFYWFNRTYSVLGGLNYSIQAFDTTGNWATSTGPFRIVDTTPPEANAGSDITAVTGTTVVLNGNMSTDNHGIENFTWEFTYGGSQYHLYGIDFSFKFERDGYYTVTLTATDFSGNQDSDALLVVVAGIDSDGDGLSDYEEEYVYGTKPDNPDTDGDGKSDGDEIAAGTDPLKYDRTSEPGGSDINDVCWFFALLGLIVLLLIVYVLWPKKDRPRDRDYYESEGDWDARDSESDLVQMDEDGRTYRVAPAKSAKQIPDEGDKGESEIPRPPSPRKKAPPRPPESR